MCPGRQTVGTTRGQQTPGNLRKNRGSVLITNRSEGIHRSRPTIHHSTIASTVLRRAADRSVGRSPLRWPPFLFHLVRIPHRYREVNGQRLMVPLSLSLTLPPISLSSSLSLSRERSHFGGYSLPLHPLSLASLFNTLPESLLKGEKRGTFNDVTTAGAEDRVHAHRAAIYD